MKFSFTKQQVDYQAGLLADYADMIEQGLHHKEDEPQMIIDLHHSAKMLRDLSKLYFKG